MEVGEWVNDFARAQKIHDFSFVIDSFSSVADGILVHAASIQADLIVLFDHGSATPRYWATSTVIGHVLTAAQVPVLIMKS